MRNWKILVVASCLLLTVASLCWAENTDKTAPSGGSVPIWQPLIGAVITEGFEGGVVPPTDWTLIQTNPNQTWKILVAGIPHSGSYAADVLYDENLLEQDELLISPTINPSSATLEFWSFGSLYWCRDTYDNCNLEVWLVRGAWGGGDDIYVALADDDWTATWEWSQTTIDLTPYLPGGPVRIAFRYTGQNGAQIALDDIQLAYEEAPPATEVVPAVNQWGLAVMILLLTVAALLRFRGKRTA
jgi:hypothetical protein